MPIYQATLDDHLAEGWGLPEVAGDDPLEDRPIRLLPSPAQVARMVGLWAASKEVET
jgi:hypothetical protein